MTKHAFTTYITLVDTETECIEHTVNVEANYHPGQAEVRYYADGSGSPEEPDEVEITKVTRQDTGEEMEWDSLPQSCKDKLEEDARRNVYGGAD